MLRALEVFPGEPGLLWLERGDAMAGWGSHTHAAPSPDIKELFFLVQPLLPQWLLGMPLMTVSSYSIGMTTFKKSLASKMA